MTDTFEMADPRDKAFAAIASGALFNETILPSGTVTPSRDMEMVDGKLIAVDREEWLSRHHGEKPNEQV